MDALPVEWIRVSIAQQSKDFRVGGEARKVT